MCLGTMDVRVKEGATALMVMASRIRVDRKDRTRPMSWENSFTYGQQALLTRFDNQQPLAVAERSSTYRRAGGGIKRERVIRRVRHRARRDNNATARALATHDEMPHLDGIQRPPQIDVDHAIIRFDELFLVELVVQEVVAFRYSRISKEGVAGLDLLKGFPQLDPRSGVGHDGFYSSGHVGVLFGVVLIGDFEIKDGDMGAL